MLKDKLAELLTKKKCVVGDCFITMDKETQGAFCEIMASSVGDYVITRIRIRQTRPDPTYTCG